MNSSKRKHLSEVKKMAECGSELEEVLKCGICLYTLKEPKVLQCGHTFCLSCLKNLHLSGKNQCPVCRKPLLGLGKWKMEDLTTNFALKAVIDSQKMEVGNVSKNDYCNSKQGLACDKHIKEPRKFWCSSCLKQVCSECLLFEHMPPTHVIRSAEDERLDRKKILDDAERKLHRLKDFHLTRVSNGHLEAQTAYSLAKEALMDEVRDAVKDAKKKIDERETSLLKFIDDTSKQDCEASSDLNERYHTLDGLHSKAVSSLNKMLSDLKAGNIPSADAMGNFESLLKECTTKIPNLKPSSSRACPNLKFKKDTLHPIRLGDLVFMNRECVGVICVASEKYVLVWDERHLNLNVRLECFQQRRDEGRQKLWEYTLMVTPSGTCNPVIVSSNCKEHFALACNNCVYFIVIDSKGGLPSSYHCKFVGNSATCISHLAILGIDMILYRCNKTGAVFRVSGSREEKFNSGSNCFSALSYFENSSSGGLILWKLREREIFFLEGKSLQILNQSKSKSTPVLLTGTTFGAWLLTKMDKGWSLSFWGWQSAKAKSITKDFGEVPVGMSTLQDTAVICFRDGRVRMFYAS